MKKKKEEERVGLDHFFSMDDLKCLHYLVVVVVVVMIVS
jgi:hypothetical protein